MNYKKENKLLVELSGRYSYYDYTEKEIEEIEELDGSVGYSSWNSEAVVLTNKINELVRESNQSKRNKQC